jgi:hypothetical protein
MQRLLTLFWLAIALLGPFLAQAEAASDLARSLADVAELSNVEPLDGGVGDEPVVAAASKAAPHLALVRFVWLAPDAFPDTPSSLPSCSGNGLAPLPRGHERWLPTTSRERNAWLQLLRI